MSDNAAAPEGDLVWGGPAIAELIGRDLAKTYYALERNHLPAKKIGGLWVMSRKAWRKRVGIPEVA